MTAERIARGLRKAKYSAGQWLCCCPAHDDNDPSLCIIDGEHTVLFHCHAGCSSIDVIAALPENLRGLIDGSADLRERFDRGWNEKRLADAAERQRRHELAMRVWGEAVDPTHTLAEHYLAGRGLELPKRAGEVIRFHADCPRLGGTAPAVIVLMRDPVSFEPTGINRLFLQAPLRKTSSMMLGPAGAMMLTSRFDTFWDDLSFCPQLCVCEGVETGLSLLKRGCRCVWACGSAGSVERLPILFGVGHLLIYADNDTSGTGLAAASACAERWNATSHQRATIIMPSAEGADSADMLVLHGR